MRIYPQPSQITNAGEVEMRKSSPSTKSKTSPASGDPQKRPSHVSASGPSPRLISPSGPSPNHVTRNLSRVAAKVTSGPYGFVKNVPPVKPPPESQPRVKHGSSVPIPTKLESPCIVASVPDISVMEDTESKSVTQMTSQGHVQTLFRGNHFESPEAKNQDHLEQASNLADSAFSSSFSLPIAGNIFSPTRIHPDSSVRLSSAEKLSSSGFPTVPASISALHPSASCPMLPSGYPFIVNRASSAPIPYFDPMSPFAQSYSPFVPSTGNNFCSSGYNPFLLQHRIQQQDSEICALRYQLQHQSEKYAELVSKNQIVAKDVCHTASQTDETETVSKVDVYTETRDITERNQQNTECREKEHQTKLEKNCNGRTPKTNSDKEQSRNVLVHAKNVIEPKDENLNYCRPNRDMDMPVPLRQDNFLAPASEVSVFCNNIAAKYLDVEPSRPGGTVVQASQNLSVCGMDVSVATVNYLQRHGLTAGSSQRAQFRRTGNLMESVIEFGEDEADHSNFSDQDGDDFCGRVDAGRSKNNRQPKTNISSRHANNGQEKRNCIQTK